jgi:hypothetical protein
MVPMEGRMIDNTPHPPASLDDVLDQLDRHGMELERISGVIEDISSTLNDDSRNKNLDEWLHQISSHLGGNKIRLSLLVTVAIVGIIAILGTLRHWF